MISIDLPRPISTNELYYNVSGKGRKRGKGRKKTEKYNAWLWQAKAQITGQKPCAIPSGPVRVLIAVGTKGVSASFDGDNCLKSYLDALVSNGILPDDNRKVIHGVGMEWVDGKEGATAHITPAEAPFMVSIPVVGTVS